MTSSVEACVENAAPPIRFSRAALFAAACLLLMRVVYAMGPDLFPEEAYYWNYAMHLDFGYLDHPPLVAWLIYLGTAVFGNGEFGVRVFALVCSVITALFTYLTTSFFFGRRSGVMGGLLVQALPFFFMTGLMMTPDSSLTACWAGMLYFLVCAIFDQQTWAWWGVGVCLGLGMLSKYTIALLGPATLLFLVLDPASRVWFRRVAPYGAVALAALIFSPVVIWNAQHQWASFLFQTDGRMAAPMRFSSHQLAASILLFLTPVGLVLAVKSLMGRVKLPEIAHQPLCNNARFLLFTRVFVLTPLTVFLLFSLHHPVKLNWTGPLWLALVPMLAVQLSRAKSGGSFLSRHGWPVSVAVLGVLYLGLLHYLTFGIPGVAYHSKMELLPVGWSEMGRALSAQKADCSGENNGKTLIVGLDRNFIASEAAFYQTDPTESVRETAGAHLFGGIGLMYGTWFPPKDQEGAMLLLVSFKASDLKRHRIQKQCENLGPIKEYWLERDGVKIRPYYTRTAFNYHSR
jgi:dolichol-phosphate mannosyltransferase